MDPVILKLKHGLIVSCQAREGNPLRGARFMAAFACAAELGGAVGIRANGAADIRAIRKITSLPILGINKWRQAHWPVYITPNLQAARSVRQAGADIIAIDATHRPRRGGISPEALIDAIHTHLGCPVMADIDSLEEGIAAARAGADLVATTLSGYTERGLTTPGPDLALVRMLAQAVAVPVICEGRIWSPQDVSAAFKAGAYAVVVGTAITNPMEITRRFAAGIP
ncbi:MAG: N-acetylmannosamine-6-phosphate 2-epimerase [Chloroflexi bacterium]|nr:N-acetylmannosamine-6-phosphate 2-epimerase [Chloroflexota bacterium]